MRKLYFPFVLVVELVILAAFVLFLIDLFPTLDSHGYLFYGDAPHVPYLAQHVSRLPVTVVRWAFFILTICLIFPMMVTIILELIRWQINQSRNPQALPSSRGRREPPPSRTQPILPGRRQKSGENGAGQRAGER